MKEDKQMKARLYILERHYNDVFDKLIYQNKVVLNEVADSLQRKKLNRLANKQILTKIADMVLDCQDRAMPLEHLFGSDRAAFCDRLSKNALTASAAEKILAFLRNMSAILLLVSVIAIIVSLIGGNSIYLSGIRALQIIGCTLLALFYFPLVCYREALFMPLHPIVPLSKNMIEPDSIGIDGKSLLLRILFSLVCAAGAIAYAVFFWIYPEVLIRSSLNHIRVNVLAWVIISAIIFISSLVGEIYVTSRNYHLNYTK